MMGDKGQGKNGGETKKAPRDVRGGRRPHEPRQVQDGLKKPE
jgi:hypothetical protein